MQETFDSLSEAGAYTLRDLRIGVCVYTPNVCVHIGTTMCLQYCM